jgi:hypothetical protein
MKTRKAISMVLVLALIFAIVLPIQSEKASATTEEGIIVMFTSSPDAIVGISIRFVPPRAGENITVDDIADVVVSINGVPNSCEVWTIQYFENSQSWSALFTNNSRLPRPAVSAVYSISLVFRGTPINVSYTLTPMANGGFSYTPSPPVLPLTPTTPTPPTPTQPKLHDEITVRWPFDVSGVPNTFTLTLTNAYDPILPTDWDDYDARAILTTPAGTVRFSENVRVFYFDEDAWEMTSMMVNAGQVVNLSVIDEMWVEHEASGTALMIFYISTDSLQWFFGGLEEEDWELFLSAYEVEPAPSDPIESASQWAREEIKSAISKGFVPTDIQDNYRSVINRSEFCRMAVMYVEYATGKTIDEVLVDKGVERNPNVFTDTTDPYILAAFALGITNGTSATTFSPNGQFTRQQAARMLMNVGVVLGMQTEDISSSGFADSDTFANWAVDGVNFVRHHEIMGGVGENRFNPSGTFTRQESIVTFDRMR